MSEKTKADEPTEDEDREPESEEPTPSERRGGFRHLACFPAHLETEQGTPRSALIRDLSVSGALLLTRARLAIGDEVKLSLYLREGLEPFATTARVVREEKRTSEMVHPWTKAVAVQFDQLLPELEDEAKSLADRQAALRGPGSSR
jgi:hypothetical protein